MGMRSWPEAKFVKTDTLDNSDLQKLVTRMMELGVLTPEQGIQTINSGVFPQQEELVAAQEKFLNDREKGYYMPLVNSINIKQDADAEESPAPTPIAAPNARSANKTATTSSPSGGRPMGTSKANEPFSRKNIIETVKKMNEFELKAFASFAEKYGVDNLSEQNKNLVSNLCESIFVSKESAEWEDCLGSVLDDFDKINDLNTSASILDIAAQHQLDDLSAAILHHSTKFNV